MQVTEKGGITRFPTIKKDCELGVKITKTFEEIWKLEDEFKLFIPETLHGHISEEAEALGRRSLQKNEELHEMFNNNCRQCSEDCDYNKEGLLIERTGHHSKRQEQNRKPVREAHRKER
jgi:hypothetical protein